MFRTRPVGHQNDTKYIVYLHQVSVGKYSKRSVQLRVWCLELRSPCLGNLELGKGTLWRHSRDAIAYCSSTNAQQRKKACPSTWDSGTRCWRNHQPMLGQGTHKKAQLSCLTTLLLNKGNGLSFLLILTCKIKHTQEAKENKDTYYTLLKTQLANYSKLEISYGLREMFICRPTVNYLWIKGVSKGVSGCFYLFEWESFFIYPFY